MEPFIKEGKIAQIFLSQSGKPGNDGVMWDLYQVIFEDQFRAFHWVKQPGQFPKAQGEIVKVKVTPTKDNNFKINFISAEQKKPWQGGGGSKGSYGTPPEVSALAQAVNTFAALDPAYKAGKMAGESPVKAVTGMILQMAKEYLEFVKPTEVVPPQQQQAPVQQYQQTPIQQYQQAPLSPQYQQPIQQPAQQQPPVYQNPPMGQPIQVPMSQPGQQQTGQPMTPIDDLPF